MDIPKHKSRDKSHHSNCFLFQKNCYFIKNLFLNRTYQSQIQPIIYFMSVFFFAILFLLLLLLPEKVFSL